MAIKKETKSGGKVLSVPAGNSVAGKHLGKSSNAGLGIDAGVASGVSNAASSHGGGTTNVGSKQGQSSLDDNYGPQSYSGRMGTQGSREDMTIGPPKNRGQFVGGTTGGGGREGVDAYGSGSRKKGTASNETGTPGRSGSMLLAKAGLNGGTGGGQTSPTQPTGAVSKSMAKARSGLKGSVKEK